jgi:hypothetical protein
MAGASSPQILIARTGERAGYVIAAMPSEAEHVSGLRLVTGSIHRTSPDGEPEKWRAWLWPSAGGAMHVTQSCEAVDGAAVERLRERLQNRADKEPWWAEGAA